MNQEKSSEIIASIAKELFEVLDDVLRSTVKDGACVSTERTCLTRIGYFLRKSMELNLFNDEIIAQVKILYKVIGEVQGSFNSDNEAKDKNVSLVKITDGLHECAKLMNEVKADV